ncbi:heterokaryon incompatibility protein-domain-containing protein [Dendryphion nanum]|uniref:Heterokaryon incompatibility protein-domain-containing protein n=1 Tax=Dendryphion nanum TaxID=256645 RepID=A0A9P9IEK3_9PLEO|nr:heterokaryon incompatibility protein-domain-containing protein [Dendryphion nanum]
MYTLEDDKPQIPTPFSQCGTLLRIHKDSASPECLDRAVQWLSDCRANHSNCNRPPQVLPTRLLDISYDHGDLLIKIVEPNGLKGEYMALSHCWGQSKGLRSTTHNIDRLKNTGFPWSSMPKTFRDAVVVCRYLGISYLWIDSLCILQDNKKDWEVESSKMCDIYGNAELVLAASLASDDNEGFLNSRGTPTLGPFPSKLCGNKENIYVTETPPDIEDPLHKRGWCFQERLVSRRYLSFGTDELTWECNVDSLCECSGHNASINQLDTYRTLFATRDLDHQQIYECWNKIIISPYSTRNLTFNTDTLPALSGIAKYFMQHLQDEYLAGLWRQNLIVALLWTTCDKRAATKISSYLAPSWSWASVNTPVSTSHIHNQYSLPLATLVDAKCVPLGADPTGQIASGYIIIKGRLAPVLLPLQLHLEDTVVVLHDSQGGELKCVLDLDGAIIPEVVPAMVPGRTITTGRRVNSPDDDHVRVYYMMKIRTVQVWCLLLATLASDSVAGGFEGYGLILAPCDASSEKYCRIGMFRSGTVSEEGSKYLFDDCEETKVIII